MLEGGQHTGLQGLQSKDHFSFNVDAVTSSIMLLLACKFDNNNSIITSHKQHVAQNSSHALDHLDVCLHSNQFVAVPNANVVIAR